jgi:hypothetical protein
MRSWTRMCSGTFAPSLWLRATCVSGGEYPHLMDKVETIVLPIKREIFGTE